MEISANIRSNTINQPQSDSVGAELDAIVLESALPVSIFLFCAYAVFSLLHTAILEPSVAVIMTPLAAVSSIFYLVLALAIRSRRISSRYAYIVAHSIFLVGLANSAAHMWLTGDIDQSSNFALIFVGVGLFFLASRHLALAYVITLATWFVIATNITDTEHEFAHFFLLNFQALGISYLAHFLRLRVNRRLIAMRSEALVREEELANALEKARLYAAAEQENKAKTEFLANMSHELRTPLNAILGFSEIMTTEAFGPHSVPKYLEYSEDIHTAGDHLLSLVNDILDLSSIQLNEHTLHVQPINLKRVCENCITIVRHHAERGDVAVVFRAPEMMPSLQTDERRLKQILTNLLNNAVKFTPAGGQVSLEIESTPHGNVLLRIRDTGIGMSEEELKNATTPFWQANAGLDRSFEGTGLGLALVAELLKLMKGKLTLESQPQQGTVVTVYLPSSTGKAKEQTEAA
ncbi:MAG: ATP-binding protein [Parvibaculum sp.]|nr:ATP-binding protein [Parvibaculum sp.]